MDSEQRLSEMETRLAFQENTLQELNDALISQQQQIELLQGMLQEMHRRVEDLANSRPAESGKEPPPPHY